MKQSSPIGPTCLAIVLLMLGAPGCTETQPSTFYTLSALGASDGGTSGSRPGGLAIGLGPITLPQYVDRPQIVTRITPNRLELSEFNKWAEPLDHIFSRVLADNLSVLLGTDRVIVLPRRRSGRTDIQVEIDVTQFDTDTSGTTVLAARWMIFGLEDDEPLTTQKSVVSSRIDNPGNHEAVVAAMSRMVEELSREIARAITSVAAPS